MSFVTTAAVIGAGTSLYSAYSSSRANRGASGSPEEMARLADPFNAHREDWAQRLESMWGELSTMNPMDIMKDPQFAFLKEQGLGALGSTMASKGMYSSGTHGTEAAKFATGLSTSFLNQRFNQQMSLVDRLLTTSGANSGNPAAASSNYGQQYAANRSGLYGGIGSALGMLGRTQQGTGSTTTPATDFEYGGFNG